MSRTRQRTTSLSDEEDLADMIGGDDPYLSDSSEETGSSGPPLPNFDLSADLSDEFMNEELQDIDDLGPEGRRRSRSFMNEDDPNSGVYKPPEPPDPNDLPDVGMENRTGELTEKEIQALEQVCLGW